MLKARDIDVLILCGGRGRRLRAVVNDRPKPMVEIGRYTFLDTLIKYLFKCGFRRFTFSIGYMAGYIKKYYFQKKQFDPDVPRPDVGVVRIPCLPAGRRPHTSVWVGLHIRFSQERTPLGTGGAIKKSRNIIKSSPFLVINGDSFCKINFKKFLLFHNKNNALASIAIARNRRYRDCGQVEIDKSNRVIGFKEKSESGNNSLINAGVYIFQKEIFSLMPKRNRFSLEYDLFPMLIGQGFYGFVAHSILLDIGTPEGLKRTKAYFRRFKS